MKPIFYFAIAFIPIAFACNKSAQNTSLNTATITNWQLIQKNWAIGSHGGVLAPSKDSAVLLVLDNNKGVYVSELNGNTISQGSYTITTNSINNNQQVLQLNNFKTTGIFSLPRLYEIGTNGQVVADYDALTMNINNDTLTLSSPITPGGYTSYVFVRK